MVIAGSASLTCLPHGCSACKWVFIFAWEVIHVRIERILTNNALVVLDEKKREKIVCGKGIGFKKRVGDDLDPTLVALAVGMVITFVLSYMFGVKEDSNGKVSG